jgi:hypothetical protein
VSTWATINDVYDRWVGNDAPDDDNLIQLLLNDAEVVVKSEYPGIQARIDDELLSVDAVKLVVCRMVLRMLRNPEGLTQWQQTTGPFSQGRSFSDLDIWMTNDEKSMLAPIRRGKAFEVDPAPLIAAPADLDHLATYPASVWEDVE